MRATQDSTPDVEADHDMNAMNTIQPAPPTRSHWVSTTVAVVIVLIAIGVAIWALSPSPAEPAVKMAEPTVNAQQSDAAKGRACGAFDIVRKAVSKQTNADFGPDPTAREAVAANARLATLGGGDYLLSRLDPATPPELADAVRALANNFQDIGMNQLVGVPNNDPAVAALLGQAQATSEHIAVLCG